MKLARILAAYARLSVFVFAFILLAMFTGSRRVDAAGVWTEQLNSPTGNWKDIRSSGDGTHLVASYVDPGTGHNSIEFSSDGGATWSDITPPGAGDSPIWSGVDISSDGYDIVAVDHNGGYIWYSPNDGLDWTSENSPDEQPGAGYWTSVAISQDGQYIAAIDQPNQALWVSNDYGSVWSNALTGNWSSVAYAPDASTLAVTDQGGYICVSTNQGGSFNCGEAVSAIWQSIAAGEGGAMIASAGYSSPLMFTSAGYGTSWISTGLDGNHNDYVGMSGDGSQMAMVQNTGYIYTANTVDTSTWTMQPGPGMANWNAIALNTDGTKMAAGNDAGHVWTYDANGTPPDTTPPVITILGTNPLTVAYGSSYNDAGATAEDNVDGDVTSSIHTTSNVNTKTPGTYSVTYVVSDEAGNAATSTRSVTVAKPPSSGGGGGSVTHQVSTLESMGENKVAQSLIQEFPSLFPGTTTVSTGSPSGSSVATSTSGASKIKVTQSYKSRNNSVKIIQELLSTDPSLNYTGGVTGYFGRLTQAAVEAFQVAHGVVNPGRDGYGMVGPKTRLAMIEAYGE